MRVIFKSRPAPITFDWHDLLDDEGIVHGDVLKRALNTLQGSSSPGYPYCYEYATNRDVIHDFEAIRIVVSVAIYALRTCKIQEIAASSKSPPYIDSDKINPLLEYGIYPPHVFVKDEPTKQDKKARLIYGLPVIMNIISRLIFGDYLNYTKQTWETNPHKVGMNMYTEEGLAKLSDSTLQLRQMGIVSTDVSGWEYAVKPQMAQAWDNIYLETAKATAFHESLVRGLHAYSYMPLAFSDGKIEQPYHYFRKSGELRTHLMNSDERAALVGLVRGDSKPLCITNGDDCCEVPNMSIDAMRKRYEDLGFLITDVVQSPVEQLQFCSQLFTFTEVPSRRPLSLAKALASCVTANEDGIRDSLLFLEEHPKYERFKQLLKVLDLLPPGVSG